MTKKVGMTAEEAVSVPGPELAPDLAVETVSKPEPVSSEGVEECLENLRVLKNRVDVLEKQAEKNAQWAAWAKEAMQKAGRWLPVKLPNPPE